MKRNYNGWPGREASHFRPDKLAYFELDIRIDGVGLEWDCLDALLLGYHQRLVLIYNINKLTELPLTV